MKYSLLTSLIKYVEEFEEKNNSGELNDFVIWLNNQLFSSATNTNEAINQHEELAISFKLMHLNKELKKQTKPILANSLLSSIDEYSFLLHLNFQSTFRKMEIIELHNLEAPTGIEIIKRLIKNKLVSEFIDAEDKRAKRIKITKLGEKVIAEIKPQIDKVFLDFSQPLSLNEKIQISGIFDKLIKK